MIQIKNKSECTGCHACYSKCPKNCIEMVEDKEGFLYPSITNKEKCINCDLCIKVCSSRKTFNNKKVIETYASYNKNNDIRIKSSSGGLFTLIAEKVLEEDGIVFGVCYDKNFNAVYDYIEKKEEMSKFRGSKYVQSYIGDNFKKVKDFLEQGKTVLFVGTGCQISGLKSFLNKDYKNLITIDIVCHGVPSKKVWEKYKNYISRNRIIKDVDFRNKNKGWENYSLNIKFENGEEFSELGSENLYIQGFVNNFYLRPSCYSCQEKGEKKTSDITLGDLWGVDNIIKNFNDKKGVSLIFINSQKGQSVINKIKQNIEFKKVNYNEVVKYNPSIIEPAKNNDKRELFFKYLQKNSFEDSLEMSFFDNKIMLFKFIIKKKLKRIISFFYEKREYSKIKYYNNFVKFYPKPKIYSMMQTIKLLEEGYSISRYGDGEFNLIYGNDISFQKYNQEISNKLKEVLLVEENKLLVALPNTFNKLNYLTSNAEYFWKIYMINNRKKIMYLLDKKRIYGDSFITRFYMSYKDKSNCQEIINRYKSIWRDKDIVIIEGELTRLGVGNDLFTNCKSIHRIICPSENAFDKYNEILEQCKKIDNHKLFILAIGPTATILASDLCKLGYQALDLGHIDIQYEYFLRKVTEGIKIKGKYVNEVKGGNIVEDISLYEKDNYTKQIITKIR